MDDFGAFDLYVFEKAMEMCNYGKDNQVDVEEDEE